MMSLMERNRHEFVGNKFECWDCKSKDDIVKCTCWFVDEGNREVVRYECSDCLRGYSNEGSAGVGLMREASRRGLVRSRSSFGWSFERPGLVLLSLHAETPGRSTSAAAKRNATVPGSKNRINASCEEELRGAISGGVGLPGHELYHEPAPGSRGGPGIGGAMALGAMSETQRIDASRSSDGHMQYVNIGMHVAVPLFAGHMPPAPFHTLSAGAGGFLHDLPLSTRLGGRFSPRKTRRHRRAAALVVDAHC
jgi:hypothetical protein